MLAPRQIFRLIRWPLCLCASVLFGCAPIGARTLSTYEPVVVTPLDSVATTVPPGPMSPVPRGATCAKPEAPAAPPAIEAVPPIAMAPPAAIGPEPLALAQVPQKQQCNNQGAAAAATQPNATVPIAPPPVTAPPKKPCGPKQNHCPWFCHADPPANVPKFRPGVTIAPRELIAPVGSEVILTAAVANKSGTLVAGDPVEWTLSQGGVGEFIELGPRDMYFHPPKKIDSHYTTGRTSKSYFRITRGTTEQSDDAVVLRGQAWASVTSPQEGVSYVTAYAPDEPNWDRRKDTAKIYWVDAQWQFPPPAINPAGQPHIFTTVVSRATDQTPIEGWIVQYSVLDGPAAGFGRDAVPLYTVITDANGRADAPFAQRGGEPGVNNIQVQVIRPANPAKGETKQLVLGTGLTSKTWTAGQSPLALTVQGPGQAQLGQTITYRMTVTNPSQASTAENVVLTDTLPPQISFLSSVPSPTGQTGQQLEWRRGALSPGQPWVIELNARVDQPGVFTNCATVAGVGASAQSCASTSVVQSQLGVTLSGPQTVTVGDTVTFQVNTTNRGTVPATGLYIRNTFDPGFEHVDPKAPNAPPIPSPIEKTVSDIAPGQSGQPIGVTFRIVQPGQLCQTVELISADGARASDRVCVTAVAGAPAPTPAQLTISHTVDKPEAVLGDSALFAIVVRNNGQTVAENVRVVTPIDTAYLYTLERTDGFNPSDGDTNLSYLVPTLQPGQELRLDVKRRCERTTGRACILATVGAQGIQATSAEACVRISEPPRLNLSIAELSDPVSIGQTTGYVLSISNTGTTVARDLRLEISIPTQMVFQGEGQRNPTRARERQGVIVFDPLAELQPGASARYEISLRAAQEVRAALVEASLFLNGQAEAVLTASERTEIVRPR